MRPRTIPRFSTLILPPRKPRPAFVAKPQPAFVRKPCGLCNRVRAWIGIGPRR
jgi:hypothetical protein